jgi:hypothetical protein
MLRHVTMVLAAVAMAAFFVPGEASARGGFGGGFHGGFHGGGFHGGGFHHHGFGFGPGFAIGFGLGAPYGYYGYPPYDVYDDGYDGGCYLVRRRVLTHYGWRRRTVQVCN